ncbi:MAG: hypothetical protein ABDH21_06770 [bacterium]
MIRKVDKSYVNQLTTTNNRQTSNAINQNSYDVQDKILIDDHEKPQIYNANDIKSKVKIQASENNVQIGTEAPVGKDIGEDKEARIRVTGSIGYGKPGVDGPGVKRIDPYTIQANIGLSVNPASFYAGIKCEIEAVGKSDKASIQGGISFSFSKGTSAGVGVSLPYNSSATLSLRSGTLSFQTTLSTDVLKLPVKIPGGAIYMAGNVDIADILQKSKEELSKGKDITSIKYQIKQEVKERIKPAATNFTEAVIRKVMEFNELLSKNSQTGFNVNPMNTKTFEITKPTSILNSSGILPTEEDRKFEKEAKEELKKFGIKVFSVVGGNAISSLLSAIAPSIDLAIDNINENDLISLV